MPRENTPPRRGFLGNIGRAIGRSFNREVQGVRNGIPGTQNFQWQQAIDWAIPGNIYNSQTGRWQPPGAGMVGSIGDLFRGFRQPGIGVGGDASAGVGSGAAQETQPIVIGGGANAGVGAGGYAGPAPRGLRPGMNDFVVMREAPGYASFLQHLAELTAPRNRMK